MSRNFLLCILLSILLPTAASAQADFPSRPVRIIMPFPAGSSTDNTARLVAQKLSEKWNQPVIVDNRPGGATNIAADFVAKSIPDGYTLLWATPSPLVINRMLFSKLPYDPDKFTRISLVTTTANVLVVYPPTGSSVQELIQNAKAHPGQLSYASTGIGTSTHLSAELFKHLAHIEMTHVPYKGSPAAFPDLLTGRVQVFFISEDLVLPYVKQGSLRALATGAEKRSERLPGVPTLSETFPGFSSITWSALVGPPGMASAVVDKISKSVADVLSEPSFAKLLLDGGTQPVGGGPADLQRLVHRDQSVWGPMIKMTGAKAD